MTVSVFYFWTIRQWLKAIEYHAHCEPGTAIKEPLTALYRAMTGDSDATDALLGVQDYWRDRRNDEPCDVQIEIAAA